jgi:HEAT repeat protein
LKAPSAVPALVVALADVRPEVRCAAAEVLAQIGSQAAHSATPALKVALADPNPSVSRAAAVALKSIGDK